MYLLLFLLLVQPASVPDSMQVTCEISSADHEVDEGYFDLICDKEKHTFVLGKDTAFYRFLIANKSQKIVIYLRQWRGVKE